MFCLALLASVYLAVGLVVPPADELPHCDDWDYVETARHFVATGRIVYSDWPTTTLLTHVLWGSAFAWALGESYLVFRSSMFVMSWLGAAGLFFWCRTAGWNRAPALWVATVFALNPLNIAYEYSFMTDTTGVTAAIWLGVLLHRHAFGSARSGIGLGILSGVSYLARQTAVIPLIAYTALVGARCFKERTISRQLLLIAIAAAPLVAGYWLWLETIHGVPFAAAWQARRTLPPVAELAERLAILLLGTALYLSPVTIGLWSRQRYRVSMIGAVSCVALIVAILASCGRMPAPYERQEVFDIGIGFSDSIVERQHLHGPSITLAGREISVFRLLTSGLSLISLLAACQLVADNFTSRTRRLPADDRAFVQRTMMPLATMIMVALLCTVPTMHGRYVWPVSVLALLCLTSAGAPPVVSLPWPGVLLTGAFGVFGIVGIQDNSVCQQAVWTALRDLESQGVDPLQINGGLEYGGLRRFTPLYRGPNHRGPYLERLKGAERDRHIVLFNPMNIFAPARRYSVTYGPLPGNEVIDEIRFSSWLRTGKIYVLRNMTRPR